MPARGLRFGEQFDVIFHSADDGEVIFVDVEDVHILGVSIRTPF
jgi:hypothetical protein